MMLAPFLDVDPVEEHVQDLEQLLLDIQSEQEKQEKGISGRSKGAPQIRKGLLLNNSLFT